MSHIKLLSVVICKAFYVMFKYESKYNIIFYNNEVIKNK